MTPAPRKRASRKVATDPRVKGMTDEMLNCRESGHVMLFSNAIRERLREGGRDLWQTTRTCACCSSKRVDVYDMNSFKLIRRSYDLAEGYANPEPGTGRIDRETVRKEMFSRFEK